MYKKKRKAKRTYRVENGVDRIISEDGEVLEERPNYKTIIPTQKARYLTMYLDDDNLFEALKGLGNQGMVWGFVLLKYDKDDGVFYFGASIKEQCKAITGLSDGTIRASIKDFADSGMLLKIRNAEYMVNPKLYYTGHWDNRPKMIELYDKRKQAIETLKNNKPLNDKIAGNEEN